MREMKDSGIEWAGVIPNTWNINKGKYFMEQLTRPTLETDEVITCFRDGEVTLRSKRREEGFTVSLTEAGYQGIEIGDLVVHGMDGFAGSIGISDSRGKATPVLNVLDTEQNKRYMMYLMRTMAYCELFLSLATGIRVRTCDTNWKKLREIDYILPTIPEQKAIADFLDNECDELNTLISDIQSQIEALEEYKRSVITEAVTKGLDPDVEMKDSGIAWVGDVPKHWLVMPNKYIMHKVKNTCSKYNGEDILSLTMNGVIIRNLDAGGKMPTSFDGYQYVEPNNLLMCLFDIDVTPRCVGLIKNHGLTSPAYSQFVMNDNAYASYYNYYYTMIDDDKTLLHLAKNLRHSLTEDQLGSISVIVPPFSEQEHIAKYLDDKCQNIDLAIVDKQKQIQTIEEYKKSLIFEYVTGKKSVT